MRDDAYTTAKRFWSANHPLTLRAWWQLKICNEIPKIQLLRITKAAKEAMLCRLFSGETEEDWTSTRIINFTKTDSEHWPENSGWVWYWFHFEKFVFVWAMHWHFLPMKKIISFFEDREMQRFDLDLPPVLTSLKIPTHRKRLLRISDKFIAISAPWSGFGSGF